MDFVGRVESSEPAVARLWTGGFRRLHPPYEKQYTHFAPMQTRQVPLRAFGPSKLHVPTNSLPPLTVTPP